LLLQHREFHPEESSSPFLAAALVKITDHIAQCLQERLTVSLRNYSRWTEILEKLRKDRIRKVGGKRAVAEGTGWFLWWIHL
jgi:hypothetical protein